MKTGVTIKTFTARDGRRVLLRTPKWEDLDDLLQLINSLVREKADIIVTEEFSREQELGWLSGALKSMEKDERVYVVAEVGGKVIANSEICRGGGCRKHTGAIGIVIKEGFRDVGIGTETMNALINQGRTWNLKVLNLSVFASNKQGLHLYEKLGFTEIGRIRKNLFRDGKYVDEVLMTKILE